MKAPSTKASKASTVAKASSGSTARVGKKTRAQKNKEARDIQNDRKVPRVTKGRWTFEKAKTEAEHRGFLVSDDAEEHWNSQSGEPNHHKVLMKDNRAPTINHIVSGHTRATPPTAEERAAANAKISAVHRSLSHGSKYWMESAAIMAALKILDPDNSLTFEALPDGLGADVASRNVTSGLYAGIQFKSGEKGDSCTDLSISREDGEVGGRYESLIIIGVLLKDLDRDRLQASMTTFDFVPEVIVSDIFLFGNATEIPNNTLAPYPRKDINDLYGDNRYVVDFDSADRLDRMRQNFKRLVREKALWKKSHLWFGIGPGTANPMVAEKHKEEMKNCEALAGLVALENLRAPKIQNETTDIIWVADFKDTNVSLKTSSANHGDNSDGFLFKLGKHPNAHFCDYVFTFYRDADGNRTHVSVIKADRVYNSDKKCFSWSRTYNKDILANKIDLRAPDALQKLKAAVGVMDTSS